MSGFDEVLGTRIEVRRRTLGHSMDLSEGSVEAEQAEQDLLFPEFTKLLEDAVPGDDESEGCPLPGTPVDESLIDSKEASVRNSGLCVNVLVVVVTQSEYTHTYIHGVSLTHTCISSSLSSFLHILLSVVFPFTLY